MIMIKKVAYNVHPKTNSLAKIPMSVKIVLQDKFIALKKISAWIVENRMNTSLKIVKNVLLALLTKNSIKNLKNVFIAQISTQDILKVKMTVLNVMVLMNTLTLIVRNALHVAME